MQTKPCFAVDVGSDFGGPVSIDAARNVLVAGNSFTLHVHSPPGADRWGSLGAMDRRFARGKSKSIPAHISAEQPGSGTGTISVPIAMAPGGYPVKWNKLSS